MAVLGYVRCRDIWPEIDESQAQISKESLNLSLEAESGQTSGSI